MSSDLFAAFNSSFDSPSGKQPQQTPVGSSQTSAASKSDPFSLLAPSGPLSQPQQYQRSTPWQSYQAQAAPPSRQKPQPWSMSKPQSAIDILGYPDGPAEPSSLSEVKEEDDDAWGDFEMPSQNTSTTAIPARSTPTLASTATPPSVSAQVPPRTRLVRASTMELMTNSLVDVGGSSSRQAASRDTTAWTAPVKAPEPKPKPKPKPKAPAPDPNVLFDADDFDGEPPQDDDEFGDFETVPSPALISAPTEQPAIDLMSTNFAVPRKETRKIPPSQLLSTLSFNEGMSPYPTAPKSPSFHDRTPFPDLGVTTPNAVEFKKDETLASPSPVTAWPSLDENGKPIKTSQKTGSAEDWGTFEDLPSKPIKPKVAHKVPTPIHEQTSAKPAAGWDWDAWDGDAAASTVQPKAAESSTQLEAGPPPTNVPPPSILLSLFPQLLNSIHTSLFKPTGNQPASVKDRVLADPATTHFLRGYLALATVAARVIAGRKLRWHRDKFLSQGMTISAATGGRRGMKLSGVDKSQASHEDREAADVVAAWKDIVGRLRSAVAAANSSAEARGEARLKVPELADGMTVQTLKGALTAPKACVVCGLKRDERVGRVDFEVEDSFGEWWVEFWGHRSCRNFWLEHEAMLRQR